jgi:sporulation protein YtfJ
MLKDIMGITLDKIKEMVDADTIIGKPINTQNGTTVIPISKISYGFASGGSDLPKKTEGKDLFAGGSGAGVSVQPLGFLVITATGDVKLMEMTTNAPKENAIVSKLPDIVDKVTELFKKDDDKSTKKDDKDKEDTPQKDTDKED